VLEKVKGWLKVIQRTKVVDRSILMKIIIDNRQVIYFSNLEGRRISLLNAMFTSKPPKSFLWLFFFVVGQNLRVHQAIFNNL